MNEILFDVLAQQSMSPAFSLAFNPEAMSLQSTGDRVNISMQAYMTRRSQFWGKSPYQGFNPVILDFHGTLFPYQGNQGIVASLAPLDNLPLAFSNENSQYLNLSFHCSRSYIQFIEEQRSTNPSSNLALSVSFWATVFLVPAGEQVVPARNAFMQIKCQNQ